MWLETPILDDLIFFWNCSAYIQPSHKSILMILKPTRSAQGTPSQTAMVWWESGGGVSCKFQKYSKINFENKTATRKN